MHLPLPVVASPAVEGNDPGPVLCCRPFRTAGPRPTCLGNAMEHAGNPEMPGNRLIINHKTKVTNREDRKVVYNCAYGFVVCGFVVVVVAVLTNVYKHDACLSLLLLLKLGLLYIIQDTKKDSNDEM